MQCVRWDSLVHLPPNWLDRSCIGSLCCSKRWSRHFESIFFPFFPSEWIKNEVWTPFFNVNSVLCWASNWIHTFSLFIRWKSKSPLLKQSKIFLHFVFLFRMKGLTLLPMSGSHHLPFHLKWKISICFSFSLVFQPFSTIYMCMFSPKQQAWNKFSWL